MVLLYVLAFFAFCENLKSEGFISLTRFSKLDS